VRLRSGIELGWVQFAALAAGCSVVSALAAIALSGAARRVGLVSRSRRDRFGPGRVPLSGGPGLLLGALAALVALGIPLGPGRAVAAAGFFALGLWDDLRELRPLPKALLQTCVAALAAWLFAPSPVYIGPAVLVLLFLVNASNYLDNMDGLLPGVALAQATALALAGTSAGPGAALLLWAAPGILLLNLPPARLYLGDSGSHLVGALLACDALDLLFDEAGFRARHALPLLLLFAVPIADVAAVTISRARRRRPIFRGGTDHLSHRLVRLGFPAPRAVLALVLMSAACGAASLLLFHGPAR
jgi:UDP-GlcNAc:undecaprenyl-phosphate GlcNAc-1-phosphate transferase